ncbi:MAG: site-2 protease family protein [Saprospiraceae bacterium]|nr:site-2 protease family protein [Saprospiraceae bacterium]MBK8369855.1 site-2 protease family protein [Saprospiraceae bacterium]MBK8548225.1 site-2 protease family protein [Saprospiraceae bacterium]MBK8819212.1 site-2 protease family protein [Saprospiraceae bacterium]MBK8855768.1 site-2 protease family protein [Saprospiraceae bacterium]
MNYSLQLGKISGIKIQVHWTFILIIGWIVYVNLQAGANPAQLVWAVMFVLTLFVCVLLHELGHALAAKKYHIVTKDITLLPIGGVARLESIPEKPKQELVVALAGPLVNFVILIILLPFIWKIGIPDIDNIQFTDQTNFVYKLMIVNLWLAVFNLIPAFPMDGGRVLRAVLSFSMPRVKATEIAAKMGQLLSIIFVILGFFYNPFLIFIGFFIFIGAQSEVEMTRAKFSLEGKYVFDILMKDFPTLQKRNTIKDSIHDILNSQHKNFLIMDENTPVGTLNRNEIIDALSKGLETSPVGAVMNPGLISLDINTPLEEAFQLLQGQSNLVPVFENGVLVGALDYENITEFILIKTIKETSFKESNKIGIS